MPTETEELRIRVTLDDQTSGQLERLRHQFTQLGEGPVGRGLANTTAKAGDAEKAMMRLARSTVGVSQGLMGVAKLAGPLGGTLGLVAGAVIAYTKVMKDWAAAGTQVSNAARLAGADAAALIQIQNQMKRVGVNAAESAAMMQSLNARLVEAGRFGTATRNQLLFDAGQYAGRMASELDRISAMKDDINRANATRHLLLEIYNRKLATTQNEAKARYAEMHAAQILGATELVKLDHDITRASKEQDENRKAELATQRELNAEFSKSEAAIGRIVGIVEAAAAKPALPLFRFGAHVLGQQAERFEKAEQRGGTAVAAQTANELLNLLALPTPGGMINTAGALIDYMRHSGRAHQAGGIFTHPTMGMIGENGAEAVIPLDQLGGGQKSIESTEENTKQLRMLNDQMEQILNPTDLSKYAKGMGLGGLGAGPGDGTGTGTGTGPGGTSSGTSDGTTGATDQPKSELAKAVDTGVEAAAPGAADAGGGGDYDKVAAAIERQEGYGANPRNIPTSQNNPGNLKWGAFAKAHGATGPGRGGHAIFPDYKTGHAAVIALLQSPNYKGKTIAEIGRRWAEDPNWATAVSKFAGLPPSYRPSGAGGTDARPPGPLAGMKSAAVAGAEPKDNATVPTNVLAAAHKLIQEGGNEAGVFALMAKSGHPKSGWWCAEFAATVLARSGHSKDIPEAYQAAGAYAHVGTADPTPHVGDIALRRQRSPTTGLPYSHIAFVESVDPKTGAVRLTGGNQGQWTSGPQAASKYDFRSLGRDEDDPAMAALASSNVGRSAHRAALAGSTRVAGPASAAMETGRRRSSPTSSGAPSPTAQPTAPVANAGAYGPNETMLQRSMAGKPVFPKAEIEAEIARLSAGPDKSIYDQGKGRLDFFKKMLARDYPSSAPTGDDAATLDKGVGGGFRRRKIDGTIKIKHDGKMRGSQLTHRPAFKDVQENRQAQMVPAASAPMLGDNAASGV